MLILIIKYKKFFVWNFQYSLNIQFYLLALLFSQFIIFLIIIGISLHFLIYYWNLNCFKVIDCFRRTLNNINEGFLIYLFPF
mgnify:CR=1 FL=1|jgi:hypothetical protein